MYSEQIEQLIKSVIADGVITEKERAVLHKRAAAEGIDEDEIDVYVDGLIAQMKPIEKVDKEKTLNIDTSMLEKVPKGFRGKRTYDKKLKSDGETAERIFMNIFYDPEERKTFLVVKIIGSEFYNNLYLNNCNLYIDNHIMEVESTYSGFDIKTDEDGYKVDDTKSYELDSDILKRICESKNLKMTLNVSASYKESGKFDPDGKPVYDETKETFKDIDVSGLKQIAREFYCAAIDKNAYQEEIAEKKTFNIDDAIVARIFRTEVKKFETIKPCPSCFKQYKAINGIIVTHIEDKLEPSDHVWPEYNLKSLTNDKGVTCFYLCVRTDYQIDDLEATVNMNSYGLRHISDPDSDKDEDYFFNFFEIETSLLNDMLSTKLDLWIKDGGNNKEMEKIPKTWKQAFEYLTDPAKLDNWRKENPDGAGLFSKFKKLF